MSFFDDVFDLAFGWLIPEQEYQGGTELTFGNPSFEPVVYGEVSKVEGVIVKSKIVDPNDGDDIPNDLLYVQVVWSVGDIESIDQIYLDDEPIDSSKFNADGGNRWANHFNYTSGEDITFSLAGVEHFKSESNGYSYSVIRLEYDSEKMNRLPRITADLKGIKVTPVGGGAKVYSSNYSDILNDYLTNGDYGRGLPDSRINQARLIAEEAFSATLVTPHDGSGDTQPLMSCNVRLDGNNTLLANINDILKGCRGFLPFIDGQFHLYIERERTALVGFEITDSNRMSDFVVEDNEIKDHFNKVTIRFKDRAQQGKLVNADYPVSSTEYNTYLAEDDGVKYEKTITVKTINNMYEALQAAEIVLKRSRNALKVKVSSKSEGKLAGVGMVINVSNDAFGMVQKPFIIMSKKTKATGIIDWELLEYQGSIYPWNTKPEQIIPDTTIGDYTSVAIPTNLAVNFPTNGTAQAVVSWDSPHKSFIIDMDGETSVTGNKFFPLVNLPMGQRTFKVKAINGLGYRSLYASLSFEITVPQAPTLEIVVSSFGAEIIPSITGSYLGVTFELKVGTTNVFNNADNKGKSGTFTLAGLAPETTYNVWVRTINVAGVSAWTNAEFTTLDGSEITALIGDIDFSEFSDFIEIANREFAVLNDKTTDTDVRTLLMLAEDADLKMDLQTSTFRVGETESNISTLNVQTAQSTSQITQINHASTGILAQANSYTYTASGWWNGNTWYEGAISQRIRDLKVVTGNGNAKLSEITEVFEDVGSGNFIARGGMVTDVNGNLAGYISTNDGSQSSFDIISSAFRLGEWVSGAFKPYLYATSGKIVAEKAWMVGETFQTGVGNVTYLGGNPVYSNQKRIAIGDFFGQQAVIAADANNVGRAVLRSNGRCTFSRGSSSPAITVESANATFINGTSIKTEANTGVADFADGVAPFTGKHSYLIPVSTAIGQLMQQGELHATVDINNSLFYANVSTTPRDTMTIGSLAQVQGLAEYTPEHTSLSNGVFQPSKLQLLIGLTQQDFSDLYGVYESGYINALGEGSMLVCDDSGDIKSGQWLCSSSMKGHAMLQTDEVTGDYEKYFTDYTVAKSSETVIWANEPSNTKLIAVYYKGG